MKYIYYVFDPFSYEISGPYTLSEANRIYNYTPHVQILKMVVDENGRVL